LGDARRLPRTEFDAMNPLHHLLPRRALILGLAFVALTQLCPSVAVAQDRLRITGTGSATGGMQLLLEAFMRAQPGAQGEVLPALGSAGGIRALIDGKIDVAVSNRAPNDKERALAPLNAITYARTPLVIAVHKGLGVTALTSEQLAALYGEGAPTFANGRRARPVLRLADATDTAIVKSISPLVAAAVEAAAARRGLLDGTTDSDTADLLERTPGAFGPSTLALIESEKRPLVALAIDGVTPSLVNLANGTWKPHKLLIMVLAEKPSPLVQQFVAFIQSAPGRRIMAAAGHGQP
jgi:phosphate transport system substrate-binding protein